VRPTNAEAVKGSIELFAAAQQTGAYLSARRHRREGLPRYPATLGQG